MLKGIIYEQMKHYAYKKRSSDQQFFAMDWVILKMRPHKQKYVVVHINQKLTAYTMFLSIF